MFNLESSIANWRKEMLVAGIKAPIPLEELESHLRDELERQMQTGINTQQAFATAVRQIGQASPLKTEFTKAGGWAGIWNGGKPRIAHLVLGVLWLVGPVASFNTMCQFAWAHSPTAPLLFINLLIIFIYSAGVLGGALLCLGSEWGRRIVRMFALLLMIACIPQIITGLGVPPWFGPLFWRTWCSSIAIFSLITIWFLRPPPRATPTPATR